MGIFLWPTKGAGESPPRRAGLVLCIPVTINFSMGLFGVIYRGPNRIYGFMRFHIIQTCLRFLDRMILFGFGMRSQTIGMQTFIEMFLVTMQTYPMDGHLVSFEKWLLQYQPHWDLDNQLKVLTNLFHLRYKQQPAKATLIFSSLPNNITVVVINENCLITTHRNKGLSADGKP